MRLLFLISTVIVLSLAQPLNVQIYDGQKGQLVNNFQNWSWGTVNLQSTAYVRSGSTYSISFDIKGYTAMFLHGDFYVSTDTLQQLTFWVNGGATAPQDVNVIVTAGGNGVGKTLSLKTIMGGTIPTNSWVSVSIPFSSFGAPVGTLLDGLQFQAGTTNDEGNIYFDAIQFAGTFPQPTPVTVSIYNAGRVPVSPYIYGVNFASHAQLVNNMYTVNRWGGNAVTRYNYITDSANHASDWYFEDIAADIPDPSKLPVGSSSYAFINDTLTAGVKVLLTTPTIGWRPFDRTKRCGFGVDKYGTQKATDPYDANCGNGVKPDGTDVTGNDPHDTSVESDPAFNVGWVKFIDSTFGQSKVRWFQLDNEPGLWHETHRDVHPHPLSYDELWNYTSTYSAAYKAAYPDSVVFGPINWGWCSYMYSPADGCTDGNDRKAHGDLPLLQWYIQQITDYQKAHGVQLVDVIDVHFYPQAPNVFSTDEDPLTALLRLRSPRSLWDPTYNDESWISTPIMILQRLNTWTDTINPGKFRLAVSEYNFGDDTIITAALANANALGVFARQGVYLATRWVAPAVGSVAERPFKLYLNYDGSGSQISGDSIEANSSNAEVVVSYAYNDSKNRKLYVTLINNISSGTVPVTVDVSSMTQTGSVKFYSFTKSQDVQPNGSTSVSGGKFSYQAASWSGSLAVVSY